MLISKQISTVYNGTLITGVVLKHTPSFLEVAITSPFSKISTSKRMREVTAEYVGVERDNLERECASLLVELYTLARLSFDSY